MGRVTKFSWGRRTVGIPAVLLSALLFAPLPPPAAAQGDSPASPSYDISVVPMMADIREKRSEAVRITAKVGVGSNDSFRSDIRLSVPALPPGISASLAPSVLSTHSGVGRAQLTFIIGRATRPGMYEIRVRSEVVGSHRAEVLASHRIRYDLVRINVLPSVRATGFTLALDPVGFNINPGTSETVTLTLKPGAGFHGPVKLRLQDDPAAPLLIASASAFGRPTLGRGHRGTVLTVHARPRVAIGFHNLLITATAPTGTQTLVLPIYALPDEHSVRPVQTPEISPSEGGLESMNRHIPGETSTFGVDWDAASPPPAAPPSEMPPQKLITLHATIKDDSGKPPAFATLHAHDQHGGPVENPDLVFRVSSDGTFDTQYFRMPTHYFVIASASGCLDSPPQEISGLHDANLKFVLKRRPKAAHPKHHKVRH